MTTQIDFYDLRVDRINRELARRGITKADIARELGYTTESGMVYVRQVLSGRSTSSPVVGRMEEILFSPNQKTPTSNA